MARYECPRCEKVCYTTDPPHLCADVKKRHERRVRMRDAVTAILQRRQHDVKALPAMESVSEEIVETLMSMGVTEDT